MRRAPVMRRRINARYAARSARLAWSNTATGAGFRPIMRSIWATSSMISWKSFVSCSVAPGRTAAVQMGQNLVSSV